MHLHIVKCIFMVVSVCFAVISCSDETVSKKSLNVSSSKDLALNSAEFKKEVYRVGENVYSAVGFGLANSVMIEGKDGLIIVDTMESVGISRQVFEQFRKISDKPVKAIIYTHNHADHIMGAMGMVGEDSPEIIAHTSLDSYVQRLANKMRPVIGTRSMRMFGNYLDEKGLVNCGIGPFLGINDKSVSGYLKPTRTFSTFEELSIAGVRLELVHAPGETDDQIYVHLPDQNILICGDNFYKSFPNLYTIRGTMFRGIEKWYKSVDLIRGIKPDHLVPGHGKPISGKNEIYSVMTDYRDAIQFVHDQGIRGMNQGMTPDELVEYVKLPDHLKTSPYLQEFYGSVSWSVRALFSGNLGWFSGDCADLNPLSRQKKAQLLVKLAGGEKNLLSHAMDFYKAKDYQEALKITGQLLYLNPENQDARTLRVESLMVLGAMENNANARHYYLTEAAEIRDGFVARERVKLSPQVLAGVPMEGIFSMLSVNLDASPSSSNLDMSKTLGITFTDLNESYAIYLRRGIAEVQKRIPKDPDILVAANSLEFKAMLAELKNPVSTLAGFSYEKGNAVSMGLFLKKFKPPTQKLPYEPFAEN